MNESTNLAPIVVFGGFALAFVFGFIAMRANFCTMGAISDVVNMGHWGRMRMWLLAIAVAIIGASVLQATGQVTLADSIYQRPRLAWLSAIVGGVLFGIGMTFAGGCANRNLLRIGAGSMRSVVVFAFVGISAYMTIKGLFAQWRVDYLDRFAIDLSAYGLKGQDLPALLAAASGLSANAALITMAAIVAGALLIFVFADARFRDNSKQVFAGVVIGLVITGGWYVSGHLISFGVASALGIILGATAWALVSKSWHLEGFASAADTRDHIFGSVLMGFGGVTALGCTVGQGISGVSTLAIGSILALLAIIAGATGTMKYMLWREENG
jgi:uncharacterized membrane protein YedE/YeeE